MRCVRLVREDMRSRSSSMLEWVVPRRTRCVTDVNSWSLCWTAVANAERNGLVLRSKQMAFSLGKPRAMLIYVPGSLASISELAVILSSVIQSRNGPVSMSPRKLKSTTARR